MYLKSIEVQGFKSFANKIRFEFHNGITGIVGPNGSGKSNVSDAVRWVLGEQSAKSLRGGSMQDVIFAGTELRKPQGFAYVAITLDNSDRALSVDFDEVKVSRRLYRSGESEYQINDSPCRLRDVNELFFDTGIGQEGYSIIGQGQIEQILSGKADDRRELFDEAAGITKFRKRKTLSEKKLENERAAMVRLSDILTELEKQVEPLRKQAETAQEYLTLRESLRLYDVNLFLSETETLRQELDGLGENEKILSEDMAAAEEALSGLREEYSKLETFLSSLDKEIGEIKDAASRGLVEEENAEGQIQVLIERINAEKANQERILARLSVIASDIGTKKQEQDRLTAEKKGTDSAAEEARKKAEDAEWKLISAEEEIQVLEEEIRKQHEDIIERISLKAETQSKDQRFVTLLEQLNVREAESAKRLLEIGTGKADLLREKAEKETLIKDLASRRTMVQEASEAALKDAEEADKEVSRLAIVLRNTQAAFQADNAKLESLKNLAERYDGYGSSIRRVMETRDRVRGIHGVVADLIQVEQQYETAIETALGGRIQNIVTDSEETAKQLIEYLKKNKFGRATFLPMTSVNRNAGWDPGKVTKEPGYIGIASELVSSEEQYRGIVRSLLGRDVVIDTIDHAIAAARKYHYAFRIVTLEGELLNPGGAISGGAFRNSSNLLGRKREIEELEERTEKLLSRANKVEKEQESLRKRRAEAREEVERLREADRTLEIRKNTEEVSLHQIAEKLEALDRQRSAIEEERMRSGEERDSIGKERESLRLSIGQMDKERQEAEDRNRQRNERLEEEKKKRDELAEQQKEAGLEAQISTQKAVFLDESLMRVTEELRKLSEEKDSLTEGRSGADAGIAEKELSIAGIRNRLKALRARKTERAEELREKQELRQNAAEKQKQYFDRRDETEQRRSALDKDLFRVRERLRRTEEKLSERAAFIQSEYSLTEESARQFFRDDLGKPAQMKKETERIRTAIRKLGNVNVNAIEDYKTTNERYTFLKGQYEDLQKGEEALVKVIQELDQGMRKQFTSQFALISREFNTVFRELFGGGQGELKLEEGADVLEANISIIAQPPGKKLQNMMQMSGGEKALTAISLLFAIQNLKPSPFALLDEIEAALDDSNVDRFSDYLRKLTEHTQFIVITHRRGTMVGADRLYGITMQEKGVSTLVSVNLIEDQLDK